MSPLRLRIAAVLIVGVLVAFLIVSVVIDDSAMRWVMAGAAWTLLLASSVVCVVLVADRRSRARVLRIERLIAQGRDQMEQHHKRASVWNYHLTAGLGLAPASPTKPKATLSAIGTHVEDITWPDDGDIRALRDDVVTLVMAPTEGWYGLSCLEVLRREASVLGIELQAVVMDRGHRDRHADIFQESVYYWHVPSDSWESATNRGSLLARGTRLVLLDQVTDVRPGFLEALLDPLDDPDVVGVQALVVDSDDRILSCGRAHFRSAVPMPLLAGHPMEDAASLEGVPLKVVDGRSMAVRTSWFVRHRGFDPTCGDLADADLCLRGGDSGEFRVAPQAIVTRQGQPEPSAEGARQFTDRWRYRRANDAESVLSHAGMAVARLETDRRRVPRPLPVLTRRDPGACLRWGIKVASPGGIEGDRWGDTHFAGSLRAGFEAAGYNAVVHRHGTHLDAVCGLDDVSLVIRGKFRVNPMPGQINVLWVISHPENVTVQEVRDYDLVFAASERWACEMTQRSGRSVRPLLQATDPERFAPDVDPLPVDAPIFVGGWHEGRDRPVVNTALRTGTPIAIFGPGWEDQVPDTMFRAPYVPNDELARYYRGAPVVLADHWPEMATHGFVQNRVFDAVATGRPVVCEPVDGIEALFGGAVQTYQDDREFRALCEGAATGRFPMDSELRTIAGRVRREHSFRRRAEQLASAVLRCQEGASDHAQEELGRPQCS